MQQYDVLDAYWQEIHNIPQLSEAEEHKLSEDIQTALASGTKAGEMVAQRAIDKLVTANLRFVVSIARKYSEKGDISIDDLISEGNIALMMAARKWQPRKDGRFVNYAVYDVRKAMEQSLPQQSAMITLPKRDKQAINDLRRLSTDAPVHPGQTNTLGDMLKAGKPMADDEAQDNELSYALTRALHYLNDREKIVIKSFYGLGGSDHMTMAEIGQENGFTRERVRQIRKVAERKMRRALRKKK